MYPLCLRDNLVVAVWLFSLKKEEVEFSFPHPIALHLEKLRGMHNTECY